MADLEYDLVRGGRGTEQDSSTDEEDNGQEEKEDEFDRTDMGQVLLHKNAEEKAAFFTNVKKRQKHGSCKTQSYSCELCILRSFKERKRLERHEAEHSAPHCCTSSKQLKVLKAIHAERCAAAAADKLVSPTPDGVCSSGLLKSSADHVRAMLRECPSFSKIGTALKELDKVLAWVVTSTGMRLFITADAASMGFGRCGDTYYTESFLKLLLSWCLDPRVKCSTKRVQNRLLSHYIATGASVPFLVPHRQVVFELQKLCLQQYKHIASRGRELLLEREAFRAVTVDCAFKFLLSVKGQPKHGAKPSAGDERKGMHAVATARSLDGCMFLAKALPSEHPPSLLPTLAAVPGVFQQLEILGVDRPRDWDVPTTYLGLPSLLCIMGEPMHIVFAASSCYGSSMRPGIVTSLRKAAEKWCAPGTTPWLQRPLYRSIDGKSFELSAAESSWWTAPSFAAEAAAVFLKKLNERAPYATRLEYVKTIAAIKVIYSTELHRKSADNKTTLGEILGRAVEWRHIEYFANGSKWRAMRSIDRQAMANGTVGNEAEHADMKAWAQNVFKQTLERAVLVLDSWETSKILRHEASFYSPMPATWEGSGCEWLSRVLAKADNPSCQVPQISPTIRVGNGQRNTLRKPSVTRTAKQTVSKRPAMKRPASSHSIFSPVWKRPSTRITFR